jgi:multiple sugar transport system permease protein
MKTKSLKIKQERASSFARNWRSWAEDYLFMSPYLLIFIVFTVLPVIVAIVFSFTYFNVLEPPVFIGLDNYIQTYATS